MPIIIYQTTTSVFFTCPSQTDFPVYQVKIYPYFLSQRTTLEYSSNMEEALIVCSSGGMMPTKGGIPSNFKIISTGFFPESQIFIMDI